MDRRLTDKPAGDFSESVRTDSLRPLGRHMDDSIAVAAQQTRYCFTEKRRRARRKQYSIRTDAVYAYVLGRRPVQALCRASHAFRPRPHHPPVNSGRSPLIPYPDPTRTGEVLRMMAGLSPARPEEPRQRVRGMASTTPEAAPSPKTASGGNAISRGLRPLVRIADHGPAAGMPEQLGATERSSDTGAPPRPGQHGRASQAPPLPLSGDPASRERCRPIPPCGGCSPGAAPAESACCIA